MAACTSLPHAQLLTCPAPPVCRTLTEADKGRIEKRIDQAIKENQRFERVVVSREEALEMFGENKFKVGLRPWLWGAAQEFARADRLVQGYLALC